jgi:4-aminobutyrate aminotransferase
VSHLAPVWFKLTDLQVASGEGSWVTTVDGRRYLDFTAGIAVTSTGHCHPKVVAAIAEQAARFIHAQANCYTHPLLEQLADAARRDHPRRHRHVLLHQLRRRGHRSVGEARQAGDRPAARDRVLRIVPRPDPSHDGDDHVEDRLPRPGTAPLPAGVFVAPFPRAIGQGTLDDRIDAGLDERTTPAPAQQTAPAETAAIIHRAGARRGRLRTGAGPVPPRPQGHLSPNTGCSSSPTRCRPASAAPARCSRSRRRASSRTF